MKCLVCFESWDERERDTCPRCGYDMVGAGAGDPARLARARASFRARASAGDSESSVTRWDAVRPWAGLAFGVALLVLWLKACPPGVAGR